MSLPKFITVALSLILLIGNPVLGQLNPIRKAEKKAAQGEWSAAHELLIKVLRKDTASVEAEVALAQWFANERNPSQQVDSAYTWVLRALTDFGQASPRQRERWKRNQIDSAQLLRLRTTVDSLVFDRTKQINTEAAYADFLSRHLFARERTEAVELRDEVGYLTALRQNTYAAFDAYLKKYPQSQRAGEARARYERLLFDAKTRDRKLKSYKAFVREFPGSPFRAVAEKNIFELTTVLGEPTDFIEFMKANPSSGMVDRARELLFHLLAETDEKMPAACMTDSLRQVAELNKLTWAPIYKNQKFGFIDSKGRERLAPQFDSIPAVYKCGAIRDDLIRTSAGTFSRSGRRLTPFTHPVDIGYGFLKIGDSATMVVHKSGRVVVSQPVRQAVVLGGRFLAVQRDGLWGLYAFNGRPLLSCQWQSIGLVEGLLVLGRNGKKILCRPAQLAPVAEGSPLDETFVFDQVRPIGPGEVVVANGPLEGVLNAQLQFIAPLAMQTLLHLPFGLVRKINDEYVFGDLSSSLANLAWEKFAVNRQWLWLKRAGDERLFDTYAKKTVAENPDSIWFQKGLAFVRRGDSIRIHVNSATTLTVPRTAKINFVPASDSIRYFFVEHRNKKTVFSIESGQQLCTLDADQLEALTGDLLMITRKGKKGLVTPTGKTVLPAEYDAIVPTAAGRLSLLKDRKFGMYDIASGKLVKPIFERNVMVLDAETLVAFKNGFYGLVDWAGKAIGAFAYEEVVPFTEHTIWVKRDFEWRLLDRTDGQVRITHVKSFQVFKTRGIEKLALVQQENFFGVWSSMRGMIIPTSFSFVTNLSGDEEPLYFTAKEVEEAGIVVAIYYDPSGKMLRKQVYEEEEYAKLACPDN